MRGQARCQGLHLLGSRSGRTQGIGMRIRNVPLTLRVLELVTIMVLHFARTALNIVLTTIACRAYHLKGHLLSMVLLFVLYFDLLFYFRSLIV